MGRAAEGIAWALKWRGFWKSKVGQKDFLWRAPASRCRESMAPGWALLWSRNRTFWVELTSWWPTSRKKHLYRSKKLLTNCKHLSHIRSSQERIFSRSYFPSGFQNGIFEYLLLAVQHHTLQNPPWWESDLSAQWARSLGGKTLVQLVPKCDFCSDLGSLVSCVVRNMNDLLPDHT